MSDHQVEVEEKTPVFRPILRSDNFASLMTMLFHIKSGNAPRRSASQIPKASKGEEVRK